SPGRNAISGVRDAHEDVGAALLGRDANASTMRGVAHRVLQEIREHLVEMIRVGPTAKRWRQLQVDAQRAPLQSRGMQLDGRRDRLAYVDVADPLRHAHRGVAIRLKESASERISSGPRRSTRTA